MSDLRLQAFLNHIAALDKKQIASVKISFETLLNTTEIVPNLEVVFKTTRD